MSTSSCISGISVSVYACVSVSVAVSVSVSVSGAACVTANESAFEWQTTLGH